MNEKKSVIETLFFLVNFTAQPFVGATIGRPSIYSTPLIYKKQSLTRFLESSLYTREPSNVEEL